MANRRSSTPVYFVDHGMDEAEQDYMFNYPLHPRLRDEPSPAREYEPPHDYLFKHEQDPFYSSKVDHALPLLQQPMPAPLATNYRPFRSTELRSHAFTHAAPAPGKVDVSPLPVPEVLNSEVDATQYEYVSNDEWIKAPTEYSTSPFTEPNSPDSLPETPTSPHSSFYSADVQRKDSMFDLRTSGLPVCLSGTNSYAPWPSSTSMSVHHQWNRPIAPASATYRPHGLPSVPPLDTMIQPPPSDSAEYIDTHSGVRTEASSPAQVEETDSDQATGSDSRASSVHPFSRQTDTGPQYARFERDTLLLDMRNQGCSYKEIKHKGNFTEAESTLRGRVRMLTKDKSQRVRKPQWLTRDIAILKRAIRHFERQGSGARGGRRRSNKVPWKKISEWMEKKGSSYAFAPATCAKKWEEIN